MKKILRNIDICDWRFAKTMPENPHFYTLRKDWNDQDFIDFVLYIRNHGYVERYNKQPYTYLNINGFKYWTMGSPINNNDGTPCTILINRAKIKYKAIYDLISSDYDDIFSYEKYWEQDKRLLKGMDIKGWVLDIGCGTGLFRDHFPDHDYLGIDISSEMLKKCRGKHPGVNVIHTSLDDFYCSHKFNTIVGLYGVGSYLNSHELHKTLDLITHKGKIYIMMYAQEYYPETYRVTGISCPRIDHQDNTFRVVKFDDYLIFTNDKKLNYD